MASFTGALTDVQAPAMPTGNAGASLMPSAAASSGDGGAVGLFSGLLNVGVKGLESGMKMMDEFTVADFTKEMNKIQEGIAQGTLTPEAGTAKAATLQRSTIEANPRLVEPIVKSSAAVLGYNLAEFESNKNLQSEKAKLQANAVATEYLLKHGFALPLKEDGSVDFEASKKLANEDNRAKIELEKNKAALATGKLQVKDTIASTLTGAHQREMGSLLSNIGVQMEKMAPEDLNKFLVSLPQQLNKLKADFTSKWMAEFTKQYGEYWSTEATHALKDTTNLLFEPYEKLVSGPDGISQNQINIMKQVTAANQLKLHEVSPFYSWLSTMPPEAQSAVLANFRISDPEFIKAEDAKVSSALKGIVINPPTPTDNAKTVGDVGVNGRKTTVEYTPEQKATALPILDEALSKISSNPNPSPNTLNFAANALDFKSGIADGITDPKQLDNFAKQLVRPEAVRLVTMMSDSDKKQTLVAGLAGNAYASAVANAKTIIEGDAKVIFDFSVNKFMVEGPAVENKRDPYSFLQDRVVNKESMRASQEKADALNRAMNAFTTYSSMSKDMKGTAEQFAQRIADSSEGNVRLVGTPTQHTVKEKDFGFGSKTPTGEEIQGPPDLNKPYAPSEITFPKTLPPGVTHEDILRLSRSAQEETNPFLKALYMLESSGGKNFDHAKDGSLTIGQGGLRAQYDGTGDLKGKKVYRQPAEPDSRGYTIEELYKNPEKYREAMLGRTEWAASKLREIKGLSNENLLTYLGMAHKGNAVDVIDHARKVGNPDEYKRGPDTLAYGKKFAAMVMSSARGNN